MRLLFLFMSQIIGMLFLFMRLWAGVIPHPIWIYHEIYECRNVIVQNYICYLDLDFDISSLSSPSKGLMPYLFFFFSFLRFRLKEEKSVACCLHGRGDKN